MNDDINPDEFLPCTKDWPLHLDFKALGFLFAVAEHAAELLNAVLNHEPVAQPARKLAVALDETEGRLVGGWDDDVYAQYSCALLEVRFTHVEITDDDLVDGGKRIIAWKEEASQPTKSPATPA